MFVGSPRPFFTLPALTHATLGLIFLLLILGAAPGPIPETRDPGEAPAQAERKKSEYVRVFAITRSLNANIVSYEVRVGPAGFETQRPVRARWQMLASDGHSEELNFLEQGAFGVNVEKASSEELRFSVAALPSRKFTVRMGDDGPHTLVEIGGVFCVLDSIHISSSGGLIPSVRYAELRGRAVADGSGCQERIKP